MRHRPADIEEMAEFLGPNDAGVQRLLRASRDPVMAETALAALKRRCIKAGFDPDYLDSFLPVRGLPAGILKLGHVVVKGDLLGPEFALPKEILTQHTGLFSQSGAGKSTLVMWLILQALEA